MRLFDIGALIETPFAGGSGSALVSGRYSYSAALLSLISPNVQLDYRDAQLRVSYAASERDRLSLFAFSAYDLLGERQNGGLNLLFGAEFYRALARYERALDGGRFEASLTLGYDRTSAAFFASERRNLSDRSLEARSVYTREFSSAATLLAGIDATLDDHAVERARYADPDSPETRDFERSFPGRRDAVTGGWAELVILLTPSIEVNIGARVDRYSSGGSAAWGIDPRLAARFDITPRLRLVHAYGLVHQLPSFVLPLPGLAPAQLSGGLHLDTLFRSADADALAFDPFAAAEADGDGRVSLDELARGEPRDEAFATLLDQLYLGRVPRVPRWPDTPPCPAEMVADN